MSASGGPAHPCVLAGGSDSPFRGVTWASGRSLKRGLYHHPWCSRCGHHTQSLPDKPRKLRPWGRSWRPHRSSSRPAVPTSGLADRSRETSEGQRGRHLRQGKKYVCVGGRWGQFPGREAPITRESCPRQTHSPGSHRLGPAGSAPSLAGHRSSSRAIGTARGKTTVARPGLGHTREEAGTTSVPRPYLT